MTTLNQLKPTLSTGKTASSKLGMVALILMAGAFLAPQTASADPGIGHFSTEYREMRVKFSYYRADPAEKIYSDFQTTAKRACREPSLRQLSFRKAERACEAGLMDKVVDKLGRADVAGVHQNRIPQVVVASR